MAPPAAAVAADETPSPGLQRNMSFGIPVGMDPAAQAKLIAQLKLVISDEESSEGDEEA